MLQVKEISKEYITGDLHQKALDKVSLNLRDNEFVAILGPSGSGKTTLLNIIGGLDRYDSGDLIINGISTKKYKDRDWDSYRNHTIGFVFQSYNLIPHQSVLANVELALTISGISRSERRSRATKALEEVGLGDQLHKKPNQMSGGQMQRVAIARALVNNPDILLADEPTGALDTDTSVQVMELLKEVAKDRLVVMVTHNPELAEEYATRIVKLRDGHITDDSDPYIVDESELKAPEHKNMGKSSMSLATALTLSFNNLLTKKARTLLTAFAGSIGIIGIALILSLSTGVNNYITDIQKETMTSYPITIEAMTMDLSSIMNMGRETADSHMGETDHALDGVYSDGSDFEMASTMTTSITENNLTEFKKYLDDPNSEIHQYVGENGITYSYDTKFSVYTYDPEDKLVNMDGSTLNTKTTVTGAPIMEMMMSNVSMNNMQELIPGADGESISKAVTDNYDLVYGSWPDSYDEVVLILNKHNEIVTSTLYEMGFLPVSEYDELMEKLESGEEIKLDTQKWSYEEICDRTLYLIPECDKYVENESGLFDKLETDEEIEGLLDDAVQLKISGIIRPVEDMENAIITNPIGYTHALTDYLIEYTADSPIIKAQMDSPNVNVLNGAAFSPDDDDEKIADAKDYIDNLTVSEKAALCREILQSVYASDPQAAAQAEQSYTQTEQSAQLPQGTDTVQMPQGTDGTQIPQGMDTAQIPQGTQSTQGGMPSPQMIQQMTDEQLAEMLETQIIGTEDGTSDERLLMIYEAYITSGSYDDNMEAFSYVSSDAPSGINIYTDSFENKEYIADCIENYNSTASEENQINYTDYVGLLMSSVTTIINVISYVLIAFVAVSLVVSSIMIGIITYISVLERTKEIGILRAIGASKHNISQVFNAETFIIGLCSGVIGIGITLLALIPANAIIHSIAGTNDVNAVLPVTSGVLLVILSVILTLIGGFIPSKKAAKKDPVTALRTE